MNRSAFYAALRKRSSGMFGTSLTPGQVKGMDAILDEAERRGTPVGHLAYILATAFHETGARMQPVRESLNYSVSGLLKTFGRHRISAAQAQTYGRSGNRPANQQAIANIVYGGEWGRRELGNTHPNDGWFYRGGGLPQTTGRRNYTLLGMAADPDRSADLIPSVRMMFDAMERGIYTGKKLSDFTDYTAMRAIINGADKAELIAGYARAFEAALRAGEYSATKRPTVQTPPATKKPGAGTGAKVGAGGLALIGAAILAFWHQITAYFGG